MFRQYRISICTEGWYYLVIMAFVFGGAVLRDINLLIVVTGMMTGLFVLNVFFPRLSISRLEVSRHVPDAVSVGDLLIVDIESTNRLKRIGCWAVSIEDVIERVESSRRERIVGKVLVPCVAAKQTLHASYRGRLYRRGKYRLGPLRISSRFPFGLVRRAVIVNDRTTLTVFPRLGILTPQWQKAIGTDFVGHQRSQNRQGSLEGEFHGLRDWRSGDSRNRIHWRTSAKRDQLSVRVFERQQSHGLSILIDLWDRNSGSDSAESDMETVVSFVATAVVDQCRRGNSHLFVGVAGAQSSTFGGFASMVTMREIMEMLAVAERATEDRLPELLDGVLSESQVGSRVVIVGIGSTDLSDTERFERVWDDPAKRASLSQILCLDVTNDDLSQYFHAEATLGLDTQ